MYILKLEMQMHTKHGQMYLHAKAESRMTEWSIIVRVCVCVCVFTSRTELCDSLL